MPFTMPVAYVMKAGLGLGSLRDARLLWVGLTVDMGNSFLVEPVDVELRGNVTDVE
jgi:hypothetical protein